LHFLLSLEIRVEIGEMSEPIFQIERTYFWVYFWHGSAQRTCRFDKITRLRKIRVLPRPCRAVYNYCLNYSIADRKPWIGTADWSSAIAQRERRRRPSRNALTIRSTVSELGHNSLNSAPSTASKSTAACRTSTLLLYTTKCNWADITGDNKAEYDFCYNPRQLNARWNVKWELSPSSEAMPQNKIRTIIVPYRYVSVKWQNASYIHKTM